MKQAYLTLCAIGSLCATSHAATYSSNFDSPPYTFGANLNGLDGWTLTGASLPDVAMISTSPFPSPVSGGRAIHFGFQEIDASSAYLSRSSGSSLVGNFLGYTQFQAAFTMQDSIPTFPNRDVFAFTFRGASNENLLTIQLTPQGAQTPDPDLSLRIDQYSLASDFALSVSAPPSATPGNIGTLTEGQWSTLNVLFTPSGINDVAFDIKFQGVSAATGILTGAAGQSLGTYGMLWTPFDADDEGSNILILDDLSLVPEPSSALLLGLAGLGFMTRRRRA